MASELVVGNNLELFVSYNGDNSSCVTAIYDKEIESQEISPFKINLDSQEGSTKYFRELLMPTVFKATVQKKALLLISTAFISHR